MPTSRRELLTYGAAIGAGAMAPSISAGAADARPHAVRLRRDPFTLGVAAGDPEPDGFVIWTRLAPDPLADDGLGGMPTRHVPVAWQVATDERFHRVVRRGTSVTSHDRGFAVHVEVEGLQPSREYWYRFSTGPFVSRSGRALTAPRRDAMPSALAMSFVSCSQYEHGLFTAYRRLAEDRPDLVLHLGDYQYEYTAGAYVAPGGNVEASPAFASAAGERVASSSVRSGSSCGPCAMPSPRFGRF